MEEKTKKEVTSTEEVTKIRDIQKEILHTLEKNEVSYKEAKEILSGIVRSIEQVAMKRKVKSPF